MNSVERLRRFAALPAHLWTTSFLIVEPLRIAEIFGPVVQIRGLVLLLVAHDAFPFPSPSKIVSGPPYRPWRSLIASRDPRFFPRVGKASVVPLSGGHGRSRYKPMLEKGLRSQGEMEQPMWTLGQVTIVVSC
jgi:hypothetical protein